MLSKIEALCRNCKADTSHLVGSMENNEIKQVECEICNNTHKYEKSIKTILEEIEKLPNYNPQKNISDSGYNMDEADVPVEYKISKAFKPLTKIKHKKFGIGIVTAVINRKKISVKFKDGSKKLAQNC